MRSPSPNIDDLPWRTDHDLRFADLDPMGHINNGAYLQILEDSRTRLLLMLAPVEIGQIGYSLASFQIDFLRELTWPGAAAAALGVERIGNSSITFRQAIFLNDVCAAFATAVLVSINSTNRRPSPINLDRRKVLTRYLIRPVEQNFQ